MSDILDHIKATCAACQREMPVSELLETPLYFVCIDAFECRAVYCGWTTPPDSDPPKEPA